MDGLDAFTQEHVIRHLERLYALPARTPRPASTGIVDKLIGSLNQRVWTLARGLRSAIDEQ
jgi:hypothetical protein